MLAVMLLHYCVNLHLSGAIKLWRRLSSETSGFGSQTKSEGKYGSGISSSQEMPGVLFR